MQRWSISSKCLPRTRRMSRGHSGLGPGSSEGDRGIVSSAIARAPSVKIGSSIASGSGVVLRRSGGGRLVVEDPIAETPGDERAAEENEQREENHDRRARTFWNRYWSADHGIGHRR